MFGEVSLPVWILVILLFGTLISFYQYVIYPLIASFLSARSRMVVEEVNPQLQLKLSQFTLARRHVLADRLSSDEKVEAALDGLARSKGLSKEQIRRETWRIAWDIVPAFNPYFYFRFGYRIARASLKALYNIRINFKDEESMASVSGDDAVVFIINHRSNIDYAVANYLTSRRTILSFGVGEWSRVWPIQPVMRMAGGYFVRRNSNDAHYRLLLKRYVQLATQAKVPHAIFIEGELSKDGSVNPPRTGLLSYITEEFDPDSGYDIVFIPIGMNYDWVIEDVNVTRFNSAQFQGRGRIYVLVQGLHFLVRVLFEFAMQRQRFGLHCSRFGRPLSFRHWLERRDVNWSRQDRTQRFEQISELGDQLIGEIRSLVPATPMAVLCRIWFEEPARRISKQDALVLFRDISNRLREAGCHVEALERYNDADVSKSFDHAFKMAQQRGLLLVDHTDEITLNTKYRRIVSYYGNSVSQFMK